MIQIRTFETSMRNVSNTIYCKTQVLQDGNLVKAGAYFQATRQSAPRSTKYAEGRKKPNVTEAKLRLKLSRQTPTVKFLLSTSSKNCQAEMNQKSKIRQINLLNATTVVTPAEGHPSLHPKIGVSLCSDYRRWSRPEILLKPFSRSTAADPKLTHHPPLN